MSKNIKVPTRASVRRFIVAVLSTDADLERYCLDNYPHVIRRFSNGMDRVARLNILLELTNTTELVFSLRNDKHFSIRSENNINLLRYRATWVELFIEDLRYFSMVLFAGEQKRPTEDSLRKLISVVFKTDSDFTAFCLDYFPSVKRQFSDNMAWEMKLNILFSSIPHRAIWSALHDDDARRDEVASKEGIVKYQMIHRRTIAILIALITGITIFGVLASKLANRWVNPHIQSPSADLHVHAGNILDLGAQLDLVSQPGSSDMATGLQNIPKNQSKPEGRPLRIGTCRSIRDGLKRASSQGDGNGIYAGISEGDIRSAYYFLDQYMFKQDPLYSAEMFRAMLSNITGVKNTSKSLSTFVVHFSSWADYYLVENPDLEIQECVRSIVSDRGPRNLLRMYLRSWIILKRMHVLDDFPTDFDNQSPELTACGRDEFTFVERKRWGITSRPYMFEREDGTCLFWLRRYADGSGPALSKLAAKLAKRYDDEFWSKHANELALIDASISAQ